MIKWLIDQQTACDEFNRHIQASLDRRASQARKAVAAPPAPEITPRTSGGDGGRAYLLRSQAPPLPVEKRPPTTPPAPAVRSVPPLPERLAGEDLDRYVIRSWADPEVRAGFKNIIILREWLKIRPATGSSKEELLLRARARAEEAKTVSPSSGTTTERRNVMTALKARLYEPPGPAKTEAERLEAELRVAVPALLGDGDVARFFGGSGDALLEYLKRGATTEKLKALSAWVHDSTRPSLAQRYSNAVGVYLEERFPGDVGALHSSLFRENLPGPRGGARAASETPAPRSESMSADDDARAAAVASFKVLHPETSDKEALLGAAREHPDLFRRAHSPDVLPDPLPIERLSGEGRTDAVLRLWGDPTVRTRFGTRDELGRFFQAKDLEGAPSALKERAAKEFAESPTIREKYGTAADYLESLIETMSNTEEKYERATARKGR